MILRIFTLMLLLLPHVSLAMVTEASSFFQAKYDGKSCFDYVNADAPKGGKIKLGEYGSFNSLNPFILKGEKPRYLTTLVFDSLMKRSLDEPLMVYPLIAEKMQITKSSVIFKLNGKATFNDGSPITATDVKASIIALKNQGSPAYQQQLRSITDIKILQTKKFSLPSNTKFSEEVILDKDAKVTDKIICQTRKEECKDDIILSKDLALEDEETISNNLRDFDEQIIFTLDDNANVETPYIIAMMPIFSQDFANNKDGFAKTATKPILSSGAYIVSDISLGKSITFSRNKNYWAENIPTNCGYNNFDEIKINYYRDLTVIIEAFKRGDIAFRSENVAKLWANVYNDIKDDARGYGIMQEKIRHENPAGIQGFIFNTRQEIFKDIRVREAIALMFNFEWANKMLFHSAYTRSKSFYENSRFADYSKIDEQLRDQQIIAQSPVQQAIIDKINDDFAIDINLLRYHSPVNLTSEQRRANKLKAYELLQQAGYIYRDGIAYNEKTNQPLRFEILIYSPSVERLVLPFIQNLEEIGIQATSRLLTDISAYKTRLNSYDYDMIISVFGHSLVLGDEQKLYWHSDTVDTTGGYNYAGVDNAVVDYLVEQILASKDYETMVMLGRMLDRVLLASHYIIPHFYIDSYRVAYRQYLHRPDDMPNYDLGFPHIWWYEE